MCGKERCQKEKESFEGYDVFKAVLAVQALRCVLKRLNGERIEEI